MTLGSVGTPQGSVILPLLFNLVMIGVAERLNARVPHVRYTIYADDITLWVAGGSDGYIEEALQEAVNTIEDQLDGTGLRCSPQKSELLIVPPPGRYRKKATEDSEKIVLRTRGGIVIPKVSKLRVLGMVLEASRSNGVTVDKIITKMGIAPRLIKRVATRHRGMKEASLLRLVQSFAISHAAYVGAFHYWKVQERDRINAAIRRTYKAALGLFNYTSTAKLLELGVHNTLEEIAEAQRTSQRERLQTTRTGRSTLARLGQGTNTTDNEAKRHHALPKRALRRLVVAPLPKNMHPEHSQGRRDARAKALTEAHANDNGALYVDAAKYKDKEDTYVAVAIRATTGEIYSACSVRAKQAHQAEEAAIALALADNKCTTILSDSRTAVRNYGRNNVCASAVRVVKCSDRQCTDGLRTRLRWFPAHQGCYFGSTSPNRNETANAAARGLTRRVVAPASLVLAEGVATDDDEEEAELVTSYADVLEWYRSARRSMPDPHPQLTREQAVLYRQLQTNSVLTPALARFICPEVYESAKCSVCNSATATPTHVLWDCKLNPEKAAAYPGTLPTDIASAVTAQDSEQQLQAVQRIETALARQTRRDAHDGTQGRQPRGERWVPRRKRRDAT
ncbi:uncharacterized protein LOC119443684 [Dermacentor silvarum]|uniref:uncharacterized protein LOC119443684 n=1 Tax=Dermacentor silvarum TaxID=543639 RepID=UPI00189A640F|nr:uncharacterized protein LOC119443684 [Dermacentor silvarum]